MSILLEALRKSEKSQRLDEPLTIHADQQLVADTRPNRKGLLLLLLLIAVVLVAWIAWRQYQQPADGYQPPVTLDTTTDDGATVSAPPVSTPRVSTPPVSIPNVNPVKTAKDTGKAAIKGGVKVATDASRAQRTPVEKFQQASPEASKPEPGQSKPVTAKQQVASATVKPPTTAIPVEDKTPAPISYWELPDAVRADVPVMKFSVLVYADEPANRFVLANGKRLAEGDSVKQGLVVEEIRRDGVVFSYRLYRFLVAR